MSYQVSRRALIGNAALTPLSLFHSEMPPSLRPQSERSNEERVKSLWERLMRPFLSDPQWVDDFAYDAGHALMIPLHAAYSATAEESWTADMLHHTKLLGSAIRDGAKLSNNRIALQQYLYVFTQVFTQQAILQRDTGREDLIDFDLMQRIEGIQAALWTREPAPQWDRKPFDNMYERILWKENITDPPFSFYRAIIDEEFFNFAIAADLCNLFGDDTSVEAREAVKVADRLFERYGNHTDEGGWLFQPGVWWDHRDYAYAGYSEPSHDMRPRPIKGIATDTSHSHRFARWLLSLRDAGGSSKRTAGHQKALQGLEFQLTRKVLQAPSQAFPYGYRTTNYMDGHNGIFRWEYETQGEERGYRPYQLSGTFLFGWWVFLHSAPIYAAYSDAARYFPLANDAVGLYTGPNTTRKRHRHMQLPKFYIGGFAELLTRLTQYVQS